MATQTITFDDKAFLNQNAGIADVNKINDTDMNMIKSVVNNNATEVDTINANLQPTSLYSNSTGSTTTVALSDDYSNYSYIEIYGKCNNRYGNIRLNTTVGSAVSFVISRVGTSDITFYIANCSFSGTTLTLGGGAIAFSNSAIVGFSTSNEVYVTNVIGYK